jgi:hypothetical protein
VREGRDGTQLDGEDLPILIGYGDGEHCC